MTIETLPERIVVFNPSDTYVRKVIGTEDGIYGLASALVQDDDTAIIFEATDIPTSQGEIHEYIIDWEALSAAEEGVMLSIDADGDGIFERTVIADKDLTSEEFALQTKTVIDFEPDTLNLRSPGKVVTAYIELPEGFDVSDIVISSLKLKSSVSALSKPVKIGDYDEDGIADLMVKFDRQQVAEVLGSGTPTVTLTGRLSDETLFAGMDTIRVMGGQAAEATASQTESPVQQETATTAKENLPNVDDPDDTDTDEAFDPQEAVAFMLFEAGAIIDELGPGDLANEDSAIELAYAMDAVFVMCEDGLYTEALALLENDILQRTDGCANIGQPDEDDWITSIEGQILVYPLVVETIELLESLI